MQQRKSQNDVQHVQSHQQPLPSPSPPPSNMLQLHQGSEQASEKIEAPLDIFGFGQSQRDHSKRSRQNRNHREEEEEQQLEQPQLKHQKELQHKHKQNYLKQQKQQPKQQQQENKQKQQFFDNNNAKNPPGSLASLHKCICKKTMCLKMYCQCFNLNTPCNQSCLCINCKNTPQHHQQIMQAKISIMDKGIVGLHNCNLSEKRCNCKKSKCQKKYCECFNSGVKCTAACNCVDCMNTEGKREGEGERVGTEVGAKKIGTK